MIGTTQNVKAKPRKKNCISIWRRAKKGSKKYAGKGKESIFRFAWKGRKRVSQRKILETRNKMIEERVYA